MSYIRILLADDHAVVRAGLKALLNQGNFRVIAEAQTGEEAVNAAKEHKPDIAILDIRMPGISGIEACRQIVQEVTTCNVIMLTSYLEDSLLAASVGAGASAFILKRIGSNELIHTIEQVSRGEKILSREKIGSAYAMMQEAREAHQTKAFAKLTGAETNVLLHLSKGLTNRQIARAIYLGEGTVRNYVSNILLKLQLNNRAEAAAYAIKNDISEIMLDDDM